MRCLLLTSVLIVLLGCGHGPADKMVIHELKEEIRLLEEKAEANAKAAQLRLEQEKDAEELKQRVASGEITEEDAANLRPSIRYNKTAPEYRAIAAECRVEAEAKKKLLREIE